MWRPVAVPFQNSQPLSTLPKTDEIRACSNFLRLGRLSFGLSGTTHPRSSSPSTPSLAQCEKDEIIAKLELIFDTMRKAECLWPDFFGGLGGSGIQCYLFHRQHGDGKFLGPFSSEPAFVAGLVEPWSNAIITQTTRLSFTKKIPPSRPSRPPAHIDAGDAQQKSIMVVENTSHPGDQVGRSFDVVLVDWRILAGFLTSGNYFVHLIPLFSSGMKTGPGESRNLFEYGPPRWP
ncbi:uncharacterized protein N7487_008963 [Penicillium crustosum]|uniref:uncharacterized protein n=1 Tax=Penicillium crustosum TaxID=36656 RepID=UPI0023A4D73B|nr:uncharacterized protein N7487_008963 [Penicillium crustosum]KAJ5403067.1 hypothetical protein N7487_008963 [Penicillium crustosum]